MKTTAKVLIWMGMILQFFLIYPIIIGIFSLKKINSSTSSKELQGWAIATIFLCSTLGGIFMLNIEDSELQTKKSNDVELITYSKEIIKTKEEPLLTSINIKVAKRISVIFLSLISTILICFIVLSVFGLIDLNNILIENIKEWGNPQNQRQTYQEMFAFTITNIIILCLQLSMALYGLIVSLLCKKHSNIHLAITSLLCVIVSFLMFWNQLTLGPYWTLYSYYVNTSFGISLANFILCTLLAIFSFTIAILVKMHKTVKTTVVNATNNMECELNNAKLMLEKSVITQEEYEKIRGIIISKYYNK